jgi:hypothetical protein
MARGLRIGNGNNAIATTAKSVALLKVVAHHAAAIIVGNGKTPAHL